MSKPPIVSDDEFFEQSRVKHDIKYPIEFDVDVEVDCLSGFNPTAPKYAQSVIAHKVDFRKKSKGKIKYRKL